MERGGVGRWPAVAAAGERRRPAAPGPGAARLHVAADLGDDWDRLVGHAPHTASRRWLDLAADRLPGALTFRLVRDGRTVVAMRGVVRDAPSTNPWLDPYLAASGRAVETGVLADGPHPWRDRSAADVFPCLVVMFPNYDAFPIGPGADDDRTLAEFVDELVRWAATRDIRALAFLYLTPEAGTLARALADRGFDVVPLTGRADLEIRWDSFDGYLAGLPQKRRVAVRTELRRLDEAGVRVVARALTDDEPELLRQRCALVRKYRGTADRQREAHWFRRIRECFPPDEVVVFEAIAPDATVGFTLVVQAGDRWSALMTGTDYDRPEARFAYFATCYYAPARAAPARSISVVSYGLGASQSKRLRGCRSTTLYGAFAAIGAGGAIVGRSGSGSVVAPASHANRR